MEVQIRDRKQPRSWQHVLMSDIKPFDANGARERTATNWYTPERTLIHHSLSDDVRKATYDRTTGGRHVCICCGMALLFTMAE